MHRRHSRISLFPCLALFIALSTLAGLASGAPNDAAAKKLRDQAIDQDYLATNYAAAEKKLTEALDLCKKTSDCSPYIRARIHCDLGVVEFMLKKIDLARTEFATALLEDPGVDLDKDLANTDVQKEFAAAKGGGPPPTPAPPPAPAASAAGSSGPASQGGMAHAAPGRQKVQVPLPIYAEVPADLGVTRVIVRYKPVGKDDWKTTQLSKMGAGYGGEIPCADVGNSEGELQYYLQALDTNGDLVAASGRSSSPHTVSIVKKLEGEAPHLPGKPPPQACKLGGAASAAATTTSSSDTGECPPDAPPDFPGCKAEGGAKSCESDDDCMAGEECVDRSCQKGNDVSRPYKKNWLSLGVQAELLVMPGVSDACLGNSGYTCFRDDNQAYYGDVPAKGIDDTVLGGFATSPMVRILLGYDRALSPNLTIGGRVGYAVFGAGPQRPGGAAFMPLHLEARAAYFFGKNALSKKGIRVYGLASAGLMEVDAEQTIDVKFPAARGSLNVDAWTKTGNGFAAVGPGAMYAFTPNSGLALELKGIMLFPTFGIALGAQLAYTIGL